MHILKRVCTFSFIYAHTIVNKSTQWLTNDVLAVLAHSSFFALLLMENILLRHQKSNIWNSAMYH